MKKCSINAMRRIVLTAVFFWVLACMCSGCSSDRSSLVLLIPGAGRTSLTALNKNARQGGVPNRTDSQYVYFSFSDKQRAALSAFIIQSGAVSLELELDASAVSSHSGSADVNPRFAYGLLYDTDFSKSGKLVSVLADRPMITGLFSSANRQMRLSFAISKAQASAVRGFFLYSAIPVDIKSVSVIPCEIGFDLSGSVPRFCFADNGGTVPDIGNVPVTAFDFTDSLRIFGREYADSSFMPVFTVQLRDIESSFGSAENQAQVKLSFGGETVSIRRAPGQRAVTLYADALRSAYSLMSVGMNADMVTGVSLHFVPSGRSESGAVVQPLKTDPGLIPEWNKSVWRTNDYELFEWEQFPGLLFFDTSDYDIQDDFFKRLAFFTEKTGYIGTLVSDSVLKGKHGFNAHDYRAETLAAFFNLAEKTAFSLSEKENLLKDILLHNGIIIAERNGSQIVYRPGTGGVISVSQESPMYLRYSFIAHEGLHGLYFMDADFRSEVSQILNRMDPLSLQFLIRYFQIQPSLNYNINDTYLLENECMAYIMQQPVSNTGNYFTTRAGWNSMISAEPQLCKYVKSTGGSGFTETARILSDYVFLRWGFAAGRVSLVTR